MARPHLPSSTSRSVSAIPRAAAAGGRRGATIWCAILGLCAVAASSSAQPSDEGAKRIILASWVSGGPAPLASDVAIYDDGAVVFHGMDFEEHRERLGRTDLVRLQNDLASPALATALGRLADDTVLHRDDQETVSFEIGDRPEAGYEMCSDEPMDAAVVKLVGDLNAAAGSLFGNLFHPLPLPSPCPEDHGPWDTPRKPSAPPP
jgi:hypothetical protein